MSKATYHIAVLAGDGIGPEVMLQALKVLSACGKHFNLDLNFTTALIGGAAYDAHQEFFPEQTKKVCGEAQAILFGSVGGPVTEQHLPKWKGCEAQSILALRKAFSLSCNLRPSRVFPQLIESCPLKPEIVQRGIDILIIRELLGDIYFGDHSTEVTATGRVAKDLAVYTEQQIKNVALHALHAARLRKKRLVSIDKANVLDTGKLWRAVVSEVAKDFSDVQLDHMLVDNCAMQLILNPDKFDVILAPNMFGDILSDEAAVFPGSLGLMPSASLGELLPNSMRFGLYEPSGGSAPDIAGKDVANPIAQILSAALMLRFSFGLEGPARAIEHAVEKVLAAGLRTKDIHQAGGKLVGTQEMGSAIAEML